jgi:hypothetical protein
MRPRAPGREIADRFGRVKRDRAYLAMPPLPHQRAYGSVTWRVRLEVSDVERVVATNIKPDGTGFVRELHILGKGKEG